MAGNSAVAGRTVISKTAAILAVFATGGTHSLSTIADQTGLAVSTVHRHLTALAASGLLDRSEDGGYQAGTALRELAHDAAPPELRHRGPLVVDDLSAALGLPVRLGVLHELEVAYIEKRPGPFPGTSFPNHARLPVHASALGKALLAHGPAPLAQLALGYNLVSYTLRTVNCRDQLLRALCKTRAKGFAVTEGELDPSTSAVAVAVLDAAIGPVAALEVELEVPRLTGRAIANVLPALVLAARGLGREIDPGHRPRRRMRTVVRLPTAL